MMLLSYCTLPWWLLWALPFLLGLALGWALWARYKALLENKEAELSAVQNQKLELENQAAQLHHHISELDGDLAIAKGKLREAESALSSSGVKVKAAPSTPAKPIAAASSLAAAASAGGGLKAGLAKLKTNNLQIIEGIGPKMESVLKENGIDSWASLAAKSPQQLRALLDKYGDKYKIITPDTWPQQAKIAADGKLEDLIALQKNLDTGRDTNIHKTESKLEKHLIKLGVIKAFKKDDLKAIEGIGPKIEKLMQNNGIKTWGDMAAASADKLNEILSSAGPRFSLADPGTWPKQAKLADEGKWDELRDYQDFLQGGRE